MEKLPIDPTTLQHARELRREMTSHERKLWAYLRAGRLSGRRFRRQHPIPPYIVDFYCHSRRLIVELDGSQHSQEPQEARDAARTAELERRGYRVLRFSNWEVDRNLEGVVHTIAIACGVDLNGGSERGRD